MKIVIVSKYFPPNTRGGGEISAYNLAQGLANIGVDVHVVTSTNIDEMKDSKFTLHPIIKDINLPSILNYVARNEIFYWNSYKAISKFLSKNPDTDVVHAVNMDSIPGSVVSANKFKIPSLITINSQWLTCPHGYMLKLHDVSVCDGKCNILKVIKCYYYSQNKFEKIFGPLYAPLQMYERRKITKKVSAVVCISENIKKYVENLFTTQEIVVIPNIVSIPGFTNKFSNEDLYSDLLFVGVLGKFKGCEYVIKSMPYILKDNPNTILRIIGKGPEHKNFVELSKKLKVDKNIIFEGFVPHEKLSDYYRFTNIVVFPSVVPETFGRIAAEAMAAGKPVVSTKVGGIPEIVRHMETGILVDPKNSKQIADAVKYLLNNPDIAKKMGIKGKEIVEKKYSSKTIANTYIEVYKQISI